MALKQGPAASVTSPQATGREGGHPWGPWAEGTARGLALVQKAGFFRGTLSGGDPPTSGGPGSSTSLSP